jgi:ABC-type sugar transport system permease subunit
MRSGYSRNNAIGYFFILPSVLLILAISIYPLLNGFALSGMKYNLLSPGERHFVGLQNFSDILFTDGEFYGVLVYSFVYTIAVVALSYVLGLALALLLNIGIRARGLFRAFILVPWVVPPVIAAVNWSWVLNDQVGIVNLFLQRSGIIHGAILFLGNASVAQITVILTSVWKSFPFMMVVLLAGLQGIPKELYEAAYIDGADTRQSFWYITMPMLKGVTSVCTTLMFIWTFNNFENIYLLTQGGPSRATFVLPILTYFTAFFRSEIGYASAISVIMLVVLLTLSLNYLRIFKSRR